MSNGRLMDFLSGLIQVRDSIRFVLGIFKRGVERLKNFLNDCLRDIVPILDKHAFQQQFL